MKKINLLPSRKNNPIKFSKIPNIKIIPNVESSDEKDKFVNYIKGKKHEAN